MIEVTPWMVLSFCIAGTFFWRAVGVSIANYINPNGTLFQWFSCVAYALLSGLITRVILLPSGALENTMLFDRMLPMLGGFIIFFALKRNVLASTITAFILFLMTAAFRHSELI